MSFPEPNPPSSDDGVAKPLVLGCLGGIGVTVVVTLCMLGGAFFFIMAVCSR